MATIKLKAVGSKGFNVDEDLVVSDLADYDHLSTSSTEARFYDDARNDVLFSGKGFHFIFSDGYVTDVTQGTVSKIAVQVGGVDTVSVTGLKLAASDVFDFYSTGNAFGGVKFLLSGNDKITGTKAADVIGGFDGNDVLAGGAGNDTLAGGAGNDKLTGGAGADIFVYGSYPLNAGIDTITDFHHSQHDKIDLGFYHLNFIGSAAFSGRGDEVRTYQKGGNTYVETDSHAHWGEDILIKLKGTITLSADDFIL